MTNLCKVLGIDDRADSIGSLLPPIRMLAAVVRKTMGSIRAGTAADGDSIGAEGSADGEELLPSLGMPPINRLFLNT